MKHGKRTFDRMFTVYTMSNLLPCARLAIAVPRRVCPRAVDRNRVKRLVRETFRHEQRRLRGLDLVVRTLPPARLATPASLRAALQSHLLSLHNPCVSSS
jgi:ribonuclease P protein component